MTRRHCEAAFTLLELLVAMVLLAIVMTVGLGAITSAMKNGTRSTAAAQNASSARETMGALQRDVHEALAPDQLDPMVVRSGTDLPALMGMPPQPGRDIHDIVEATPSRLTVRVRGAASDGDTDADCVTWFVASPAAGRHELWRASTPNWRSCPARPAAEQANASLVARIDGDAQPFGYQVLSIGCAPSTLASVNTGDWRTLDRIVGVTFTLAVAPDSGRGGGEVSLTGAATPRTRSRSAYRSALGC